MSNCVKLALAAACLMAPLDGFAQSRSLIYTYLGPVAGGGMNRIVHRDWFGFYTGTKRFTGWFAGGGCSLWLVSKWIIGDFSVQYMRSSNEAVLQHVYYTATGRVGFQLGKYFIIAPGLGMYFETPPANRKYRGGAGGRGTLALLINITSDAMLFVDGAAMYGWYGLGDRSSKLFYGSHLGFVFKVGRI